MHVDSMLVLEERVVKGLSLLSELKPTANTRTPATQIVKTIIEYSSTFSHSILIYTNLLTYEPVLDTKPDPNPRHTKET